MAPRGALHSVVAQSVGLAALGVTLRQEGPILGGVDSPPRWDGTPLVVEHQGVPHSISLLLLLSGLPWHLAT